jgi:hypothetical protein
MAIYRDIGGNDGSIVAYLIVIIYLSGSFMRMTLEDLDNTNANMH